MNKVVSKQQKKQACCPKCGSNNIKEIHASTLELHLCECQDCHHKFYVEKD